MTASQRKRPARTYTTGAVTRTVRLAALVGVAAVTAWVLVRYPSMPDTVPTHFDLKGEPDEFGDKSTLLWITALMVVLAGLIAWLSTKPRLFNYPAEVTEQNAQFVYREGERMMVWILVALVGVHLSVAVFFQGGNGALLVGLSVAAMVVATVGGVIRLNAAAGKGADGADGRRS